MESATAETIRIEAPLPPFGRRGSVDEPWSLGAIAMPAHTTESPPDAPLGDRLTMLGRKVIGGTIARTVLIPA